MTKIGVYRVLRYLTVSVLGVAVVLVGLFLWSAEPMPARAPERHPNVPAEAIWAGGVDGGNWHLCTPEGEGYQCTIYHDVTGDIEAHGLFVPRRIEWNTEAEAPTFLPVAEPLPTPLPYDGYDGQTISLGSHLVLVPHGVIDHPFGDGHGKRQTYRYGEPQGEAMPY